MRRSILVSSLLAACVMLPACNSNNMLTQPMMVGKQDNMQIVQDLMAVNKNEIASARIAEHKAANPAVKKYARFLVAQHEANLKKAKRFAHGFKMNTADNSVANNLAAEGAREQAHLQSLSGKAFDKAFLDDMVADHQNAVHLLDNLIKDSTHPKLTHFLEETRHHVEMHLQKAMELQKQGA